MARAAVSQKVSMTKVSKTTAVNLRVQQEPKEREVLIGTTGLSYSLVDVEPFGPLIFRQQL